VESNFAKICAGKFILRNKSLKNYGMIRFTG